MNILTTKKTLGFSNPHTHLYETPKNIRVCKNAALLLFPPLQDALRRVDGRQDQEGRKGNGKGSKNAINSAPLYFLNPPQLHWSAVKTALSPLFGRGARKNGPTRPGGEADDGARNERRSDSGEANAPQFAKIPETMLSADLTSRVCDFFVLVKMYRVSLLA